MWRLRKNCHSADTVVQYGRQLTCVFPFFIFLIHFPGEFSTHCTTIARWQFQHFPREYTDRRAVSHPRQICLQTNPLADWTVDRGFRWNREHFVGKIEWNYDCRFPVIGCCCDCAWSQCCSVERCSRAGDKPVESVLWKVNSVVGEPNCKD